ncbi:MAG: carbohydrate ABC transporter substrate-binding protein [Rhodobacteraceae bacterium]|nr:carbohydrate ABC transporter substrate-binding protein [Paracoccaceae bacterium]
MTPFARLLLATAIALPDVAPALAEGSLEGIHHWVSESEVNALKVITDKLASKGFTWVDSAVGGLSGANATQALRTRIAAGNPPATMQFLGYEGIDWAAEGVLVSLNDLYAANGWEAALPPQILQFVKADDTFFATPVNMHRQNWVWANKAIFDQHDITPPTTWEEMIAAGDKLRAAGVTPLSLSDETWQILEVFESILAGQGGAEFYRTAVMGLDPDALASETMVKAFDTLRAVSGMVDEGIAGRDWAVATGRVAAGEAAMQIMGDWAKGEFLAKGMQPGVEFLCFPTPGEAHFSFVIDAFGMFRNSDPNVTAAQIAWAESIMDPEVQRQFNLIKGSIPARIDVPVDDFDACAKQGFADREAAIASGAMLPGLTDGFAVPPQFAGVFFDVVGAFFVTAGMTSQDAVSSLVAGIENAR